MQRKLGGKHINKPLRERESKKKGKLNKNRESRVEGTNLIYPIYEGWRERACKTKSL